MVNISPLIDFEQEPITRQTLQSMWNGALGAIGQDDLADDFLALTAGSDFSDAPSSPRPGEPWWHISENVLYVYHDVVDGTGVSLWLAAGPDKFETPLLAAEPIAAAAPVDLTYDRFGVVATPHGQDVPRLIGFNQSGINGPIGVNDGPTYGGETTASGTWFRCGVDGLLFGKQDFATSHPSEPLLTHTQAEPVTLEIDTDNGINLTSSAGGIHSQADHAVGITTQWWVTPGNSVVTEPSYIAKFMFAPRIGNGAKFPA